ncbi:MAG: oxidoreductase [Alphaproteobacteria bacterium]|jgi:short-subunit dehydrogenase|nr:SDR family NAD(P)-dependent oxidoreductase [Pelagibacterales bacterium]RUA13392.1 MAG: oxidoreductase [Alphaproteobacteria bacterium]RUA13729.1 MAG: oxidoreductase [Alphaproteobacteria bacterium]RUA20316.1 MAG: oxidoreductase [Alphaproteobacteria bacterium]HIN07133.1 SDR family NAD(P)-dependent oxidoreductase [Pelagibacteraceae bacterium]|tara:strand:+ start:246 stop:920 length:675 start_codon:yes stop_codon:yes gene_type:complete
MNDSVLIVGVGSGLSASLARLCASKSMKIVLAARNIEKLEDLINETNADAYACDSSNIESVENLFKEMDKKIGTPNLVIYNPSARIKGGITELDAKKTQDAINVTCFGAFLVAKEAAKRMIKRKSGSIFFTGASAGVKGFANSSVFAMGKFGLRGLAQSLARELHPQNIHIGHFIIDGAIGRKPFGTYETINPDLIAKTYLEFHNQDKSAWSWEIELRTSVEKF